jgi:hypothetical protein
MQCSVPSLHVDVPAREIAPHIIRPGSRGVADRLLIGAAITCTCALAAGGAIAGLRSHGAQERVEASKPSAAGSLVAARTEVSARSAIRPRGSPRTFSWPPVRDAVAYDFILLRGQDQLYVKRVRNARLTLAASWRYGGKLRNLHPGVYRWIVLPVRGSPKGKAGEAVVAARLVVG